MSIFSFWDPVRFHGSLRSRHYFEGWYFKHISAAGGGLSLIPGVSFNRSKRICFLQCIHGPSGRTFWAEWPISEFKTTNRPFSISVSGNRFSLDGIDVDLRDPGFSLKGSVAYSSPSLYPFRLFSPGVMGPYAFMPFMECYHAVISLDHRLSGKLRLNGKAMSFDGGRGYCEKDWGVSFPAWWVWAQSNSFSAFPGASFTLSVARVPWLGSAFTGYLAVLRVHGRILTWASWTGSRLVSFDRGGDFAEVVIANRRSTIRCRAVKKKNGVLKAPVFGAMSRAIHESLDSVIDVECRDRKGKLIFSGTGTNAGFELVGLPDNSRGKTLRKGRA